MKRHAWLLAPLLTALILAYGISQLVRADSMSGASGTSIDAAACVTTTADSLCTRTAGITVAALNTGTTVTTIYQSIVAPLLVGTISRESLEIPLAAAAATAASTSTWQTANSGLFYGLTLTTETTFGTAWVSNGTVASGSLDIALYGATFSRVASTGSSLMSGTEGTQNIALSSSYTAAPGNYWIALAVNNTSATFNVMSPGGSGLMDAYKYYQTSVFPLPATAAPVTSSGISQRVYVFGLHNLPRSP